MFEVASERGSFKRGGREGLILLERRALENESRERARRTPDVVDVDTGRLVGRRACARSAQRACAAEIIFENEMLSR